MAKEIKAKVKMLIKGGSATPAPPVGSSLGQHGVQLMEFCKQFNAKTSTPDRKGKNVPVVVTVYKDRSFDFLVKTPPTSELIREKIGVAKGSSRPNTDKVGQISWDDIADIAKIKMPDLNAFNIDQAKQIVAGTARSMGIDVID
jgi:large subunit ribosomal protein L11